MGDATCTVAYVIKTCNTKYQYFEGSDVWNKSSNKDTEVIALTKALNYQRIKFDKLQKNYIKNRSNKFKSNKKIHKVIAAVITPR